MDGILLSGRLLLALVLAVAGLAKLADSQGSREAVRAFGVPEAVGGLVSGVLPLAELAAAILLVPTATARAGSGLAALLLICFCAGITRSIVRGEAPDCHCFGQLHSSPAGPKALARNALLTAVAVLVIIGGAGTSATAWIAHLSGTGLTALIAGAVLAAVIAAAGAFALSLLRQHGGLLLRIDALEQALSAHGIVVPTADPAPAPAAGLPVGEPAPAFELRDLRHRRVSLESLTAAEDPVMLIFTDPGCGPCTALMPQIGAWQRDHADDVRTVLVSRGSRDANAAHADDHGVADVLLQRDREVSERYLVSGTPSAVLVAADGKIASGLAEGADAITALMNSLIEAPLLHVEQHVPTLGVPAPSPALRTLDGEDVQLSSMLSGTTAVLFWNPTCGFCDRMLPDLRRFEATRAGGPNLLLISTGDPQTNRDMGLLAPILLDDSFRAGSAFGAGGTPSAVLVDESGLIASGIAVGAHAVLELIGADGALAA
jgi:methylamine dehydrogenase accessory protein MauD